jgi:hypothetical protein
MLVQSIEQFNQGFIETYSKTKFLTDEDNLKTYEVHLCATKPGKIGKSKDLCRK